MERDHRSLHGKAKESRPEENHPGAVQVMGECGRELSVTGEAGKLDKVEASGCQENGQKGEQQSDAADHGVEKNWVEARGAMCASPQPDQEKSGIRLNSQKRNQWTKFSAVKVPKRPASSNKYEREVDRAWLRIRP